MFEQLSVYLISYGSYYAVGSTSCSVFTNNQHQLFALYPVLFEVKSATCFGHVLAFFRKSYVAMFERRIIPCDYNCCVYSYDIIKMGL